MQQPLHSSAGRCPLQPQVQQQQQQQALPRLQRHAPQPPRPAMHIARASVCCTATAHGSLLHSQHHQQLVALPPCHPGRSRQQQQQQQQQQQRAARGRSARLAAAASNRDEPPPSREDRANPTKADFSAYWSLKFREFFSKRRAYLQAGRKQQEQPEIFRKLDEAIAVQEEKLEAARQAARRRTVEKIQASPDLQQRELERDQQLLADAMRARDELHAPRLKLAALTAVRLRAAVRAVLLAPFTLPAALFARWQGLFAGSAYQHFLLAEGERVWGWRNRSENERWFWEVLAVDRLLVPVLWTVCYQAVVPNNLLWAVFVPLCLIAWQSGRVPGPGQLEWWLTMYLGLYLKCWDQVCWLAAALFQWC